MVTEGGQEECGVASKVTKGASVRVVVVAENEEENGRCSSVVGDDTERPSSGIVASSTST